MSSTTACISWAAVPTKIEQHSTVTTQARKCKSKGQGRCMVFDATDGPRREQGGGGWGFKPGREDNAHLVENDESNYVSYGCITPAAALLFDGQAAPRAPGSAGQLCHRRRVRGGGGGGPGAPAAGRSGGRPPTRRPPGGAAAARGRRQRPGELELAGLEVPRVQGLVQGPEHTEWPKGWYRRPKGCPRHASTPAARAARSVSGFVAPNPPSPPSLPLTLGTRADEAACEDAALALGLSLGTVH